jgi:hypothetical protein
MKKLMLILAATLTSLASLAALPQPDLIAQIHFAGGDRISADKNYSTFTNEFSSAEALALRKQTADKLAPWLAGWLQTNLGTAVPDGATKLRPLFDDLQSAEWFLEARAAAGGKPDVAIAIQLAPAHAQAWELALKPYFPAATFSQSAGWLIFDSGTGAIKAGDLLAQKLAAPPAGWLGVDVNWPRLAQWYPELKQLALPETKFDVSVKDTNLDISGKWFFLDNLSLKLDAWQFPSNTIHEPLTSFTAARGFAGWLSGQDWAQPVKLSPPANQMFIWALKGSSFQTFAAAPLADSAAALLQLDSGLQPVVAWRNEHDGFLSPFTLASTNDRIALKGTPFISAFVQMLKGTDGQFLFAGAFPNTPRGKALPPKIFEQLAMPGLVYYHLENTALRQPDLLNLSQLLLLLTRHKQLDGTSAAFKWVTKTSLMPGLSATTLTQTAPDQLTFARTSPGGLTALELLSLANWLEASDFPHCNLSMPPIPERVKQLRARPHTAKPISIPGN